MKQKIKVNFGNDGFSLDAELSIDGNQWCVFVGEDLQTGVAGFGSTITRALHDFKINVRNMHLQLKGDV